MRWRLTWTRSYPRPGKVVANLPYGVAAGALLRTIAELPSVALWVAMIQREVGERLAASPGTGAYGTPSVLAQLACEVGGRAGDPAHRLLSRSRTSTRCSWGCAGASGVAGGERRIPSRGAARSSSRCVRPPPQDPRRIACACRRVGIAPTPLAPRSAHASRCAKRCRRSATRRTCAPSGSPRRTSGRSPGPERPARAMSVHRALAPAKVNLGLFLGGRRAPDGRHELVTVMQSISLADELTLQAARDGAEQDELVCSGVPGPPQANLAAAALAAFRARAGWDAPPMRLTILKRIPVAAGLGGGSADAAATLRLARARLRPRRRAGAARAGRRARRGRARAGLAWALAGDRCRERLQALPPPRAPSACSSCRCPPSCPPLRSTPRPTASGWRDGAAGAGGAPSRGVARGARVGRAAARGHRAAAQRPAAGGRLAAPRDRPHARRGAYGRCGDRAAQRIGPHGARPVRPRGLLPPTARPRWPRTPPTRCGRVPAPIAATPVDAGFGGARAAGQAGARSTTDIGVRNNHRGKR